MFNDQRAKALLNSRAFVRSTATALALLIAAGSAMAETTIKWMHLEIDPTYISVWKQIVKNYEAERPGTKIEMQ